MSNRNISQLIQQIARKGLESDTPVVGTVQNVRPSEGLCDVVPVNEDSILFDVKLRTQSVDKNGNSPTDYLVIEPADGSQVIVDFLSTGQAFVAMYSEIATVNLFIGDISLFLDNSVIELNGNNNEGLVKVVELTSRLNAIEDAFSTFKSDYNSHVHANPEGGNVGAATPQTTADAGSTSQSKIENPTVKHGE